MPRVDKREVVYATPWCNLVAKTVRGGHEDGAVYYVIDAADYVSVFALREDGKVILVRQFRPAVEQMTLELPAGTVGEGEPPEQAARRELEEETGYTAQHLELLGKLKPDTGRLGNHIWLYLARQARPMPVAQAPEPGIEIVFSDPAELHELIGRGEFDHALSLVLVLMAQERLNGAAGA